ncbi:two-partner secretion domain-containing protein [Paraburkholderia nodosa]|uniref:two-partner secretion domain-containing protein n=1 Tax=Paraburkholderia nodosa TaxID=392320 RepID=UPI00048901DF|nr:filamentous hemagglutinin N-terminal domain-containing protein [Paraburkholderia nodosa]
MQSRWYVQARSDGLRALFVLLTSAVLAPPFALAGVIVPDGRTATTVTTTAGGAQTVNIAPAVAGVSQNTYSTFNVGAAGATLNNVGINARTIVNQVTSTNPSLIEGAITVAGSRANVILANPNGITVNGGSFINAGHVALTTGQVSFSDVQIAPGVVQRNVVLGTTGGTIVIGPGGLSSALVDLDLIAKNVQVNGALNNTFSSGTALTRILAGTSSVTLNTGFSASDNANDWMSITSSAANAQAKSFALDITAAGSIASGRIELIVTDQGPGVRSAGPLNASLGNFSLSSNGAVQFSNSSVNAATDVSFSVKDALAFSDTQVNANNGAAALTATGAMTLTGSSVIANGAVNLGANGLTFELDSAQKGSTVASASAGVVLQSSGDIVNVGSLIQGQQQTSGDTASKGAVTIAAAGNVLNQSNPGGALGILFGVQGDVSIVAGGDVVNENARVLSNNNVNITAGGDFSNIADHTTGVANGAAVGFSQSSSGFLFFRHRNSGFNVDYGQLADANELAYVTADSGNVTINANNIANTGGSILSNNGAVSMTALGTLDTQAVFTGQAAYRQSCFIFCKSSASSSVQAFGGVIEAGTDISLKAGTQITNTGGTVLAVGKLSLDAPRTLAQAVLGYSAINETHDLKAWFGNGWASIYATDTGGLFEGGSGAVELTGAGEIDGGAFIAPNGVHAGGGVVTTRPRWQQPVGIGTHNSIGLVSWFGL